MADHVRRVPDVSEVTARLALAPHDIRASDLRLAAQRRLEGRQRVQQRRLAGAVWPEQCHPFTRSQGQGNTSEHMAPAESHGELIQRESRRFDVRLTSCQRR